KFELFTDHKRERNIHLYKGLGYHKGKNEVVAEDFGCNSNSLGKIFLDKKSNLFNSITAS
ncbi:MAG: hypothetical protein SVW57_13300, partial [Thermodesulfobacteriota bacterium]|nr:hypothetical protein [Thermodesulfobacteriota bacterium]